MCNKTRGRRQDKAAQPALKRCMQARAKLEDRRMLKQLGLL